MASNNRHTYLIHGRLSDVLALIQVLALSPKTRRTNDGLFTELQGNSKSATDWIEIGRQHREFFRVVTPKEGKPHVALIARTAQEDIDPDDGEATKPVLSPSMTARLMEMATDMHARQVQQRDAWKVVWVPIAVAVLAAIASISAAVISAASHRDPPRDFDKTFTASPQDRPLSDGHNAVASASPCDRRGSPTGSGSSPSRAPADSGTCGGSHENESRQSCIASRAG